MEEMQECQVLLLLRPVNLIVNKIINNDFHSAELVSSVNRKQRRATAPNATLSSMKRGKSSRKRNTTSKTSGLFILPVQTLIKIFQLTMTKKNKKIAKMGAPAIW
jgi:hypothetical protein